MRLNFAGFAFDSDTREVFRKDAAVPVSPKAFELLELLIRNRPRAVSKEEIHERLWPKTFVSDASLSNLVAELRATFDDDARRPRVLRTVQRFGYAFIAEAHAPRRASRRGRRSSAGTTTPRSGSTTPGSRGGTPGSSWTAATRPSRTSAARTEPSATAPESPGRSASPTATGSRSGGRRSSS